MTHSQNELPGRGSPNFEFPDIDGYVIELQLGEGAHGQVFKAIDMSLQKPVAIKVLNPIASKESHLRERFEREIKAYHSLKDGHVIQLRSHGRITHGAYKNCPYVIMEFMDGGTFGDWMNRMPAKSKEPLRVSVEILVGVCKGLSYIHKQNIVHRDLKPDNILLAELNENAEGQVQPGQVRISDFGLIANLAECRDLSRTGMGAGTPAYMSPEQFVDSKNVTPASDQYAIGVMLYQLLCNRRPWQSSSDEQEPQGMIEAKAISKTPCPPPSSSARKLDSQLKEVCLRCLEPTPEERYANVDQLRESLKAWLNGDIDPHSRSWIKRTWRTNILHPIKRRPGRVFLLIAAFGFLAPWGYWMSFEYAKEARQAIVAQVGAEEQAALSRVVALQQATPQAAALILRSDEFASSRMQNTLRRQLANSSGHLSNHEINRIRLALLKTDAAQVGPIMDYVKLELIQPKFVDELGVVSSQIVSASSTPRESVEFMLSTSEQRLAGAFLLAGLETDAGFWKEHAQGIANDLVSLNPLYLSAYSTALRPIRDHLIPALTRVHSDPQSSETSRSLSASLLASYAEENTELLSEILLAANPDTDTFLLPILLSPEHRDAAVKLIENVFEEQPDYSWKETPIDSKWDVPSERHRLSIESAHGILGERFAFCLEMPMSRFVELSEALRPAGYRPTHVRPHRSLNVSQSDSREHQPASPTQLGGGDFLVAAVWVRDGGDFEIDRSLPAEQVPAFDPDNQMMLHLEASKSRRGLLLQDVCAVPGENADSIPNYLTIWSKPSKSDKELSPETKKMATVDMDRNGKNSRVADLLADLTHSALMAEKRFAILDLPEAEFIKALSSVNQDLHLGFRTGGFLNTLSVRTDSDGIRRYTGVLSSLTAGTGRETVYHDCTNIASAQFDISISPMKQDALKEYRDKVKLVNLLPMDQRQAPETRILLAIALYQTSKLEMALAEMDSLLEEGEDSEEVLQYHAWTLARLGLTDKAKQALKAYTDRSDGTSALNAYVHIIFNGWQGDFEAAAMQLQEAERNCSDDPFEIYNLACAAAICSRAAQDRNEERSAMFADRALILLERSLGIVQSPYLLPIATDPDLLSLQDDFRFQSILSRAYPFAPFAGVFRHNSPMESRRAVSTSAQALRNQIAPMLSEQWRPTAIAVGDYANQFKQAETDSPKQLCALVLHRPVVQQSAHDTLAIRQAAALTALLRLGISDEVWTRLRLTHRADVRSSALTRMADYHVNFHTLANLLQSEPEGNGRAFLVLALGELARETRLTGEQRSVLVEKLRLIYKNDGHGGTHAAARWALRQCGESPLRSQIDYGVRNVRSADRNWVVNSQDQTFVFVKKGTFFQGSPATEVGRSDVETLHQTKIDHDFWMSTSEVTKSEWMNFSEKSVGVLSFADPTVSTYMPSLDSPMVGVTWDEAAQYCNWLSNLEGIPKDQWCYEKVDRPGNGMRARIGSQTLTGYRLPTEAEWEFACRAGVHAAYSFGSSEALLSEYARFLNTSGGSTGPVDELKPNDIGLFGMHGNVAEWCEDGDYPYPVFDVVNPFVEGNADRIKRGGSWNSHARECRSASRGHSSIDMRLYDVGFRVVRTAAER